MVDDSKSSKQIPLKNVQFSSESNISSSVSPAENLRLLRKKDRQLAGAQAEIMKLKAETVALQKRRNELVKQNAKLKRELSQESASRGNEAQTRVRLEKYLAAEKDRATKYKSAYDRLKSHPFLRLSRAVTAPAKSLLGRSQGKPVVRAATSVGSISASLGPETNENRPNVILAEVAHNYRVAGNASVAQKLARKLPPGYDVTKSDRILLDQIDGVVRLLDRTPRIPDAQHGIGYVPQPDRVMYCAHSTGGFNSNGYSTRTAGITQALAELGTDIFVAARPGYPWDAKTNEKAKSKARFETVSNGVRTVYNPGTSWSQRALDQYVHEAADIYAREAMINRPSKIVAASNHVTALPALIAARRLGVPFAYEVRGLWEITEASGKDGYEDSERFALAVKLETLVATNADHVFAITTQVKDELVRRGVDASKISLLPNAADIYEFAPLRPEAAFAADYKLEGGFTLGYAGSVLEYEGLDLAIRSVAEIVNAGEPIKLVVVGDGPALADLKTMASELELGDSVQFLGRVPASEVPRFIELFDAVVCPRVSSIVTEMVSPLKPLEAMSAGKPVIASDVAPLADLLGTHGTRGALFKAGDASDLARVIRELAGDRAKRNEMGREARMWITKNRSWATIARQQLEGLSRATTSADVPGSKPLGDMTIALISDEFTRTSMQGDVNLVLPTPTNWKAVFEGSDVDLLFVESAWEGNDGAWSRKVGYYDDEECRELRALISHCRSVGIPTVFWNKEDPVHFNRFRKTAKFFDHVFTTDANCLKDYWGHRGGHLKTLASLPFWAQPKIHNPLPSGEGKNHTVAYGGSYYGERFEKRSKELVDLLDAAIPQGLTIYDRQFNNPESPYVFPEHLQQYVQGGLPYSEMLKAYKNHPVHINVNSVSNSPTMFSRRVFELAGSGTPVLSGPGLEIGGLFGTAIPSALSQDETEELASQWMTDEPSRINAAWAALRVVYRSHLSTHRLAYVMRIAGLSVNVPELPRFILELDELTEASALDVLEQSQRPIAVVARIVSYPEASKILAQHGIDVLGAVPKDAKVAIGSLGNFLKDAHLAEDLVTAMHYSGCRTASIDAGEASEESHSLWQVRPANHGPATMVGNDVDSADNVTVRRVPVNQETTAGNVDSLYAGVDEPLNILVAGHDLKFATGIMDELAAAGHKIAVDKWAGHSQHDPEQSLVLLEDADVIFCEWSLGNLAWYSQNKLPGQRLVSRFHSQELFTNYPTQVDFENVDQIIFVGEFIRRVAIRKFGIPESLTSVIPNAVDLASLDLPKTADARFNLGLVGIVPEQKRLDVALDLLSLLRATDDRYKLFIKGRRPEGYPWMAARPQEMAYYEAQYERIENDPALRGAVTFDEHGNDMPEWFRKIGVALSVSDFESFHFTLADGAASGAVPVILSWPGAEMIYPDAWISRSIGGMSDRILKAAATEATFASEGTEAQEFAQSEYRNENTLGALASVITTTLLP
ncbi:glycosyltransferase [Paeniglutamicibacter sp. ABSL32-1]|uniref:glycosyltransferase n=1 Tax=Paeniglutamicibacter quisquiliarum TaxID=2849498 RepID=UPI001C2D9374|nr:glycosyltransferase [Paeniglutamicibacter quisquiliarum]MBV1780725.1 glycosyltransferase [Paeniglutamicibacter quisquiliarum]